MVWEAGGRSVRGESERPRPRRFGDGPGDRRPFPRPQTLGYSLLESPAGLAAWLGEKLVAFADTRPEGGGGVSLAQQLDNIALYWFTGTGASTARWYWEAIRWVPRSAEQENAQPVTVPTACTLFPAEPYPIARRWAERRFNNLISWNQMDRGGHYPGWEQPDLLVAELRSAFRHARGSSDGEGQAMARRPAVPS